LHLHLQGLGKALLEHQRAFVLMERSEALYSNMET
jgi:hypothetical protein